MSKSLSGAVERVSETYRNLFDGTQTVGTTASPLHNGVELLCRVVLIQSHPDNTQRVIVGNNASQSIVLVPGQSESISVDDVSKVYVKSTSGMQVVNWHALEV